MLASLVLAALFGGLIFGLLVLWRNYRVSSVPALFVVVPIAVFGWVAFAVVVNLITYFMPPVMYTRRCSPVDAVRAILQLIFDDPAPFILFILFMVSYHDWAAIDAAEKRRGALLGKPREKFVSVADMLAATDV